MRTVHVVRVEGSPAHHKPTRQCTCGPIVGVALDGGARGDEFVIHRIPPPSEPVVHARCTCRRCACRAFGPGVCTRCRQGDHR